jgi:hypothetical protein
MTPANRFSNGVLNLGDNLLNGLFGLSNGMVCLAFLEKPVVARQCVNAPAAS